MQMKNEVTTTMTPNQRNIKDQQHVNHVPFHITRKSWKKMKAEFHNCLMNGSKKLKTPE